MAIQLTPVSFTQSVAFALAATTHDNGSIEFSLTVPSGASELEIDVAFAYVDNLAQDLSKSAYRCIKDVSGSAITLIAVRSRNARKLVDVYGKLTGCELLLSTGARVTVERSNGYVLSGWTRETGWWAIDLRNEDATVSSFPEWWS